MVHSEEADAKAKALAKAKAKEEFMKSLKQLVESRKFMTTKPDLSIEELAIIMALYKPEGVIAIELQKMIIRCLPYYAEIACDSAVRGWSQEMTEFRAEFARVFQQLEVPWIRGGVPAHAPNLYFASWRDPSMAADAQSTWTIEWEEAEVLLQRRLGYRAAHLRDEFRFLDLPAELRNRIYEMVVGLPKSGVSIEKGQPEARLMSRNYEDPLDLDRWSFRSQFSWPGRQYCDAVILSRPLIDMLAIFRKLDIVLDEQDFLARLTDKKGNQKCQDMMQVPGMSTLREMRGLQAVNFDGNCDGVKAILEPLLLLPKGTTSS
ncbi:hypothetical protein HII31_09817 [Pseudocercospora fuligena]|uniref:Uncharacterized protein n=1 Tax=Pseudocercospora fuligena TaxID=685502 RepID=A0A8H6VI46_9PEZI|nr:hypothetical protein HII31_09817 [Pseudocercospora fuligena]